MQKPPPSESQVHSMMMGQEENGGEDRDLVVDKEAVKFDSNVYDSEYEESVSQNVLQKRI